MGRYVIRRLLWVLFVLVVIVFITYVIFFLMPAGDPAVRFAGKGAQPEVLATVQASVRAGQTLVHPVLELHEARVPG